MTYEDSIHLGEFNLIRRFFMRESDSQSPKIHQSEQISRVLLGIGDDCALLSSPPDHQSLAVTSDMLVENRHFFSNANPFFLGQKSLAVNLSDLAAMGASPIGFTLSIALPEINEQWLSEFSKGLHLIADRYACPLIGGDTTAGPLTISITAIGQIPPGQSLSRHLAQPNDDIWVSNVLGDARFVLGAIQGEWQLPMSIEHLTHRMHTPTPRIELGQSLRGIAHAAIDVSDGLLGDLNHILKASQLDATIWIDQVPSSAELMEVSHELRRMCTLKGGDDYELCFTASEHNRHAIENISRTLNLSLTRIGIVTARSKNLKPSQAQIISPTQTLIDHEGHTLSPELSALYLQSFDHFKSI